jgi:NADH-quinone oxidoreductase subunit J
MIEGVLFKLFAAVTALFALIVVVSKDAYKSAVALIGTFICLACIYVLLYAHLVAVLQVIIYAGAIMVLFVFVIALSSSVENERKRPRLLGVAGVVCGALVAVELLKVFYSARDTGYEVPPQGFGTLEAVSRELFTNFFVPFELVSVLMLAAIMGTIIFGKEGRE